MRSGLMRSRSLVKYLILLPLMVVVLLNVRLISQIKEFKVNEDFKSIPTYPIQKSETLVKRNLLNLTKNSTSIEGSQTKIKSAENTFSNATNAEENLIKEKNLLKEKINEFNQNPVIRNKHFIVDFLKENNETNNLNATNSKLLLKIYPNSNKPFETKKVYKPPKFFVILIQVHSRLAYLKELIESLRNTKYIEQTLVIFSHDIFDKEINELISRIDFCAILQIFYPLTLQLYPDQFPGKDPNDCPKSIEKSKAILSKCNNAHTPDSYGHYREHTIVQIKHHWFWKLGFVFEKLNETKNLDDLHVLLLEEDYYLLPDSIHVLRKLYEKILSDIDVVSLAIFEKQKQNIEMNNLNMYSKAIWHSANHNTGLFFGRAQWNMLIDCLNAFCTYDDYNWDWTLQYVSLRCFKLPLVSIFPVSSRVIHIGQCGTHHKGKNCDPKEIVDKLKKTQNDEMNKFFPDKLDLKSINTGIRPAKKPNGGWSDPRDFQLCKSFASQNITHLTVTINLS